MFEFNIETNDVEDFDSRKSQSLNSDIIQSENNKKENYQISNSNIYYTSYI